MHLLIVVIVAFCFILGGNLNRGVMSELVAENRGEEEEDGTSGFETEIQKLHHQQDIDDANQAQREQGHKGVLIDHAKASEVGTKFDAQVKQPLYKLVDNNQYEGALTIVASRDLEEGEEYASGQTMLQLGKIQNPSPLGYIEDVWTYDVQSKSFYAVSKIHRQAILMTCGQDSLDLLESRKALAMNAWLYTGGDMVNAATTGVKSYLHILERRITQADIDAIGI